MDYSKLATPPVAVADFCLIPIGTPSPSVSAEIAAVQRLLASSGLHYALHSAGTTVGTFPPPESSHVPHAIIEGSWDAVMRVIGQAHTLVHQNGVLRVQTDIRVGTRTDKAQRFEEKVTKVQMILAADGKEDVKKEEGKKVEEGKAVDAEGNQGHVAGDSQVQSQTQAGKKTWASMFQK